MILAQRSCQHSLKISYGEKGQTKNHSRVRGDLLWFFGVGLKKENTIGGGATMT